MGPLRLLTLALLIATPAMAAVEPPSAGMKLSGSVALVSDYRFRGISLSDRHPAIQGGLTASHKSGVYVAAWVSNVDGFGELGSSNLEVDLSGGYRVRRGTTTFDAGLLYYAYPGSSGGDFEFFEPYASVSHQVGLVTGKLGLAFAPEQPAIGNRSNIYLSGDLSLAIKDAPIVVRVHFGRSQGKTSLSPGNGYSDWSLGVETVQRGLTFGLAFVDTSISEEEARKVSARPRDVSASLVMSVGAGF